jgi:hypothetical protein
LPPIRLAPEFAPTTGKPCILLSLPDKIRDADEEIQEAWAVAVVLVPSMLKAR